MFFYQTPRNPNAAEGWHGLTVGVTDSPPPQSTVSVILGIYFCRRPLTLTTVRKLVEGKILADTCFAEHQHSFRTARVNLHGLGTKNEELICKLCFTCSATSPEKGNGQRDGSVGVAPKRQREPFAASRSIEWKTVPPHVLDWFSHEVL